MCRKERFGSLAFECAKESKQRFRHGAIITKNSKIIVKGFNDGSRTKILDQIHPCVHAEIDVLNKLVSLIRKKNSSQNKKAFMSKLRKSLSKYTIWVIRISNNINSSNKNYYNSIPCQECLKVLKYYGITKVGFSDENGDIIVKKINDIKEIHVTSSNESYNKYMKYLKNMNV